ncbi:unnamed protein product [Chrysoparadoxa australica]
MKASFGLKGKSRVTGRVGSGKADAPGQGQRKKMVIKPFKEQPQLPPDFEDQAWSKLRAAVLAVQSKQPIETSREELYRAVEDLCAHKMSSRLYDRLQVECERHIREQVDALAVSQPPDPAAFLCSVDTVWQDHCKQMLTVRSIFLYLDRSFVLQTPALKSIWDLGLHQLRAHIQRVPGVQSKTVAGVLALVEKERNGEDVDRDLMRSIVRMLCALGVYHDVLSPPFLSQTATFYKAEGLRLLREVDVPTFFEQAELRLHEESERCVHYLDPATRKPLVATVEAKLLVPHTPALLESGFEKLMKSLRLDDLRRLYSLLARPGVDQLHLLKVALVANVEKVGTAIVSDSANDKEMVPNLLTYREQLDQVLSESMQKNEAYHIALKAAWERFLNVRENRPAELLAKFLDSKLRGDKSISEDAIGDLLEKIMVLFRYLASKDVFEAFYKKALAKRLLLGKSASFDLEKSMIAKFKCECGSNFTSKLEGMFKDTDLSRDLMGQYDGYLKYVMDESGFFQDTHSRGVDVNIKVLTMGYWPAYPPMEVTLPPELAEHSEKFRSYYMARYQGRCLAWQHQLGSCILKASFPKGRKELAVSQLQAVVLMCFRQQDRISFRDLKDRTSIEDGELRRTLQSLACAKVRPLRKEPHSRDVMDDDVLVFNKDFSAKLFRIRINSIQMKEPVEENTKTYEAVFRDRQYQVDAAIVRIMKARKTLSHPLLMSELFGQIKFPAQPADLKRRIESLIEREYLERDEDNSAMYNYLA